MKIEEKTRIPAVCGNCGFWAKTQGDDPKTVFGNCKRYPPVWTLVEGEGNVCVFPLTDSVDGCGEFKLRIDA